MVRHDSTINCENFVRVRSALAHQKAAARFETQFGQLSSAVGDDAPEMKSFGDDAETVLPLVYHLTYSDSAGSVSSRTVTLRSIQRKDGLVRLLCHCHLRHAPRTFFTHKIIEVFDLATGEVHENPTEFFLSLPSFGTSANAEALRVCHDELVILTCLAACDGNLDENELTQILVFLYDRNPDSELRENVLRSHLALLTPDEHAFWQSAQRLDRLDHEAVRIFRRAMRRIIDADGVIEKEEALFVQAIESYLPQAQPTS